MLNLPLLKRQALRFATGIKRYEELSDRQWVICSSEKTYAHPAIYLENELDKVTGIPKETTYDFEMERIRGGLRSHGATTAYQLQNVQIRQGYIYKKSMRLRFTKRKESLLQFGAVESIDQAALACTSFAYHYFGHLLLDDLPLALAAAQIAPPIILETPAYPQINEYKNLFNIHPRLVQQAHCAQLTIIDDIGQNQFKRDRYRSMRSQLIPHGSDQPPRGVMLRRGKLGAQRSLVNESEVIALLESQGFITLVPEDLSAAELVRQMVGTKIVIGVEGSQLAHGVLTLATGGVMCALQPPYRFNNSFKDYLDCIEHDLRYAFVIGKRVADGFEIDLNTLAKTLDRIDQVLAYRQAV